MELNLKLREKDKIVKEIIEKYKRAQLNILFLDQHYNYYPQTNLFKIKDTSTPYNIGESSMLIQLQKNKNLKLMCSLWNRYIAVCQKTPGIL